MIRESKKTALVKRCLPSRSLTYPLKSYLPNRKVVFQPPFFRGELLNFGGVINFPEQISPTPHQFCLRWDFCTNDVHLRVHRFSSDVFRFKRFEIHVQHEILSKPEVLGQLAAAKANITLRIVKMKTLKLWTVSPGAGKCSNNGDEWLQGRIQRFTYNYSISTQKRGNHLKNKNYIWTWVHLYLSTVKMLTTPSQGIPSQVDVFVEAPNSCGLELQFLACHGRTHQPGSGSPSIWIIEKGTVKPMSF